MGTRHLVCVRQGDKFPVAQYGHLDGYPSYAGIEVLAFAQQLMDSTPEANTMFQQWKEKLKTCLFVPEEVADTLVDTETQFELRLGAGVLQFVLDTELTSIPLINDFNFGKQGLFCEWAYVIDLDDGFLDVYEGFKKHPPLPNNLFGNDPDKDGYYPPSLVKRYPLNDLPTEEQFIAAIPD